MTGHRIWFYSILTACVVASLAGCNKDDTHERGPNPYRRDIRTREGKPAVHPSTQPAAEPATRAVYDPHSMGPPVLFVNKDALTVQDVLEPQRKELARLAASLPPPVYRERRDRILHEALREQLGLMVIYQDASKTLTEKEEKAALDLADEQIQELVNLDYGGLHAKFEKYLSERGMTVEEYRQRRKERLIAVKAIQDRFHALTEEPSRDELKRYYDAHPEEFTIESRASMSLIEVRFAQDRDAARKRIERAQQELASGTPFEAVAKTYSDGIKARTGGKWEEISSNSLRERYAPVTKVLFAMQPGDVSPIIIGSDAFFIVRCDTLTPGHKRSFQEAQPEIRDRALSQKFAEIQNEYVYKLLSKAIIVNETAFIQALRDAAPLPQPAR